MNHDDELDALLRSALRSEAEPTAYQGGLEAPVFQGVRRRRQRRIVGGAVGAAAVVALVVGGTMALDEPWARGPGDIHPAGSSFMAGPSIVPVTSTAIVPQPETTSVTTPPEPTTSAPGTSSTTTATATSTTTSTSPTSSTAPVDRTATDWSDLPTGRASDAWVAYSVDGSGKVALDWGGRQISTSITAVENPQLRLALDEKDGVILLVRGALATSDRIETKAVTGEDVYLVRQDGTTTPLFHGVTGSTVTEPTGKGLTAAYLPDQGKIEVRSLLTGEVVGGFTRPSGDSPMTWSKAGMILRSGDVVDENGTVKAHVDGVRTATTSASTDTMYAVTDTEIFRVASTGTAKVGDVRPGEGRSYAGASPLNTHVATTGGVMDLATGEWVIHASGTIDSLQWADDTTIVFIRPQDNVRCDIVSLRCERVDRGATSPFSQLKN